MPFRTVCIKSRGKLSYSLNYLIFRSEEEKRIHLSEISTLIIQTTAAVITTGLISELMKRKINVILCDSKSNPQSEIIPFFGSHNTSNRVLEQSNWSAEIKNTTWKRIVEYKILSQAQVLEKYDFLDSNKLLISYAENVIDGDKTNREGHAAKVYFNALFGKDFNRGKDSFTNACLNYGYAILLSAFNREIVSHGYITQLGIHHINEYNQFNLGCDLMEPFRPIIDDYVKLGVLTEDNFKKKLRDLLNIKVYIDNKEQYLENAIKIYTQSVFSSINKEDTNKITMFDRYEL